MCPNQYKKSVGNYVNLERAFNLDMGIKLHLEYNREMLTYKTLPTLQFPCDGPPPSQLQ